MWHRARSVSYTHLEKSQDETDPGAQEELKANAQKLVDTLAISSASARPASTSPPTVFSNTSRPSISCV